MLDSRSGRSYDPNMQGTNPQDERPLLGALSILTFATGFVDAASVLGLGHVFTANMTGNVVFLGFSLVGAGHVATVDCVVALVAFLAGAALGGRLAAMGVAFKMAILLEACVLLAATVVAWVSGDGAVNHLPVIALLASGMGIQNAAVRKLGVRDMTTTVLTLTLTGIAADSWLAGGDNPRLGRRLASVVLMLFGGLAGALLSSRGIRWTIAVAASLAFCGYIVAPRKPRPPQ
jgi:uncharacterized membrane protein YoaK (UPF0700 family)